MYLNENFYRAGWRLEREVDLKKINSSDVCDLKEQLKGRKDGSVLEDHLSEDWEEHQERIYEWRGVVDHIEIDSADYNEMECVGRMITYRMRTLLDYD